MKKVKTSVIAKILNEIEGLEPQQYGDIKNDKEARKKYNTCTDCVQTIMRGGFRPEHVLGKQQMETVLRHLGRAIVNTPLNLLSNSYKKIPKRYR